MLKKILRGLFTIIGCVLGYIIADELLKTNKVPHITQNTILSILFLIAITLVIGFMFYLLSPLINNGVGKIIDYVEKNVQKVPATEILFGTGGAIIGLIVSVLFVSLFKGISPIFTIIAVIITFIMAIVGAKVAVKKREDIITLFENVKKGSGKEKKSKSFHKGYPKVLDTSVIIDGRIFDLCQTGFIEGTLVIPGFVLEELRHIADSSDGLKRTRGRRGLDILNKIQKELNVDVEISEKDYPDIAEVDSKLLKLAQDVSGKVITNDYNLNKVAEFQGVPVLNINELANAIKPVVIPGEEMNVQIVKDGKEFGQGVAYLDDGTMIVVEGGKRFMGEVLDVIVTSVLQTAAGRMIFAKPKND